MINPEALIFGGGGSRILATVSAIEQLIRKKQLDLSNVKIISGVSAGAILGALIACRLNIDDLYNLMSVDFSGFQDDEAGYIRDAVNLFRKYGVCKGKTLGDWLDYQIDAFTGYQSGISHITFRELYDCNGIALYVWAFNVNRRRRWEFSPFKNGNVPVAKAVHASCAIPGIYQPVQIGDDLFTDGGWACNYPDIPLFRGKKVKMLGFKLYGSEDDRPRLDIKKRWGFADFLGAHIDGAMSAGEQLYVSTELWEHTVKIDTGSIKSTDFKLTDRQRTFLVEAGIKAADSYMNKN